MERKVLTFDFVLDDFPVKFPQPDTIHNGAKRTVLWNTPISFERGKEQRSQNGTALTVLAH